MIVPIRLGQEGLHKPLSGADAAIAALPPGALTDAQNVRVAEGYVVKADGRSSQLTTAVDPYGVLAGASDTTSFHAYMGLAAVRAWFGTTHTDITRAAGAYTGGPNDYWNWCIFNGLPVLNNGKDVPQLWSPPSTSQVLVNLTNWPATVRAKVIRTFKNYLVALYITKSSTVHPRMVKWSHSASSGVPSSWDETDPTLDAGENVLSEGEDLLVDCLRLGDSNVIYGESSTWEMRLAGVPFIFSFHQRFPQSGILAQQCAALVLNRHFVVTGDDIVLHDLSNIQSIADLRTRRWFFKNLNRSSAGITRTVVHETNKEVWILFPTGDSSVQNLALVWNWVFNTWTVKELPGTYGAAPLRKLVDTKGTWDGTAGDWDSNTNQWDTIAVGSDKQIGSILLAGTSSQKILLVDNELNTYEGANFTSFIEREGIAFLVNPRTRELFYDMKRLKMLTAICPQIEAPAGTQFTISVKAKDTLKGPYGSATNVTWTAGTDTWKSIYVTGRFLSVKISDAGNTSAAWSVLGYDLDLVPLGEA